MLAAYAKIGLTAHLVDSTLPDEPWFARSAAQLLPAADRRRVRRLAGGATRSVARSPRRWSSTTWSTAAGITFVAPRGRGDRRRPGRGRPRVHRRARDLRPRVALARDRGARRRVHDRGPARRLPRDPPGDRSGHPLAGRRAVPDQGRRPRDRSLRPVHRRAGSAAARAALRDRARQRSRPTPSAWSPQGCRARCRGGSASCSRRSCCSMSSRSPTAEQQPAAEVAAAALRAVGPVQRRRDADQDHRAAARRPVVGAGAGGAAARRLRRAEGDHVGGAARRPTPGCRPSAGSRCGRTRTWPGSSGRRRRWPRRSAATEVDLATLSVALRVMRSLAGGQS